MHWQNLSHGGRTQQLQVFEVEEDTVARSLGCRLGGGDAVAAVVTRGG